MDEETQTTVLDGLNLNFTHQDPETKWSNYKPEIRRLYLDENWTLEKVMEHMEEKWTFHARCVQRPLQLIQHGTHSSIFSLRQYKRMLEKWDFTKYRKRKRGGMEEVADPAELRMQQGTPTTNMLDSREPPSKKSRTGKNRRVFERGFQLTH